MALLTSAGDPVSQCGNDLRYMRRWLHQPHAGYLAEHLIGDLAEVTQALVQVLVSSEISNHELGRVFRAESAKALTLAAARLAAAYQVPAHA